MLALQRSFWGAEDLLEAFQTALQERPCARGGLLVDPADSWGDDALEPVESLAKQRLGRTYVIGIGEDSSQSFDVVGDGRRGDFASFSDLGLWVALSEGLHTLMRGYGTPLGYLQVAFFEVRALWACSEASVGECTRAARALGVHLGGVGLLCG